LTALDPACFQRLPLEYDEQLSNFVALWFQLELAALEDGQARALQQQGGAVQVDPKLNLHASTA